MNANTLSAEKRRQTIMSVVLAVICVIYVLPVAAVVINSFKVNPYVKTNTFELPTGEMWAGFDNFIKGMTFGNYSFWKCVFYSAFITIVSTALILICTSMAAWYIARVNSTFCKAVYYLCVFSMVVPFQMVMYTLSKTADKLKLNTPWTIPIVYLGFGAGLAIFMFVGFVKSIPIEIEEAAAIDGATGWKTFRYITLPLLGPTTLFVSTIAFTNCFKLADQVIIMTEGAPNNASTLLLYYIYQQGFTNMNYGRSSALTVIMLVLLMIVSLPRFFSQDRKIHYN